MLLKLQLPDMLIGVLHDMSACIELVLLPCTDPRGMTAGDMQSSDLVAQAAITITGWPLTQPCVA